MFLSKCDEMVVVVDKYIAIISKLDASEMHVERRKRLLEQFSSETDGMTINRYVRF